MTGQISIKQSLKKAHRKQRPTRAEIDLLKIELVKMLDEANPKESEEYHKGLLKDFLKKTAYSDYFINTKDRSDLVIHNDKDSKSSVGVIIETKRPGNKTEMPTTDNLNKKATQELLLYFLRERFTNSNIEIKHLIATDLYEWFVFDAHEFARMADDPNLKKAFTNFEQKRLTSEKTNLFYKEIAYPKLEQVKNEITFTYFDIRDYEKHLKDHTKAGDTKLIELQKILSPTHLLKLSPANDSNTLNKEFYNELLHIIGLEEYKEKSKKLIRRKIREKRNEGSLIEAAITQITSLDKLSQIKELERFGDNVAEQLYNIGLELVITWINRILFLKLLESQIVGYHKSKDYVFLNNEKVAGYGDLNTLFFQVLAVETKDRQKAIQEKFPNVPYLNSSLFEPTELEKQTVFISNLPHGATLPLYKKTLIKSNSATMSTLEYLLKFLDAYDFASEGKEDIAEDNKTLINASVLGLIFEKINGYKDGSFFTPGFITMYMCRETIRRAIVQKFREQTDFDSDDFGDLVNFTTGTYKKEELKRYNDIINSLKICDPAVGSGHFLVSALNEIIAIKAKFGILTDDIGKRLQDFEMDVENDELMILDSKGDFFKYDPKSREAQRIQKTFFHEKQTIIENCLFGVDINPNSVNICRLRLWIELLKNAYYKDDGELETLPNIDINIKCGNSLISRYPLNADLGHALVGSTWNINTYRLAVMTYRNAENKEQKREAEKLIQKIKSDFHTGITENDPIKRKRKKIKEEFNDLTSQGRLFGQDAFKKDKKIVKRIDILAKDIADLDAEIEDIESGAVYRNAFEWRFEFPEVLDEKTGDFTGFDIVIGNPPYIEHKKLKYISAILKANFTVYAGSADLYVYFYEKGVELLKKDGIITFISSNKFIKTSYGEKLRELLSSKAIQHIIDFTEVHVFSALVASCIIIVAKRQPMAVVPSTFIDDSLADFAKLSDFVKSNYLDIKAKSLGKDIWQLEDDRKLRLKTKIETGSDKFCEFDTISICRGVTTGCNEAFVIDESTCSQLIKQSAKNKAIIKPLLQGRNIRKWFYETDSQFLIFTRRGIDIGEYPVIEQYLSQFKKQLEPGQGRKPGPYNWYEIQDNTTYYPEFEKDKIIWGLTADKWAFAFDDKKHYLPSSGYILTSEKILLKYLLALLNSKLMQFYFGFIGIMTAGGAYTLKHETIRELPIKDIPTKEQQPFINYVDKILAITKFDDYQNTVSKQTEAKELEKQIDQIVYKLYDLTPEEIAIVEGKA
jgi:hypothetical protein